jgi:hypothetical protein
MAIAVEVLGVEADVEQDRLDGRLGDHHRPEHGLLGLQVLGRDDRALSVGGQLLLGFAQGSLDRAVETLSSLDIGAADPRLCPVVELNPREPG